MQANNAPNNDIPRPRYRNKTLPRVRSRLSTDLIYAVSSVFLISAVLCNEKGQSIYVTLFILFSVLFPFIFIVEIVFRLLYIAEEYRHLSVRYENDISRLLKVVFYFPTGIFLISMLSLCCHILINVIYGKSPFVLWFDMGLISSLFSLLGILIFKRNLSMKSGSFYESLWIENSNGLDYGSGMAHSFFHGYLKLMIPRTGTSEKHLEELMKDYEDEHHVKLVFYKLFILIPKSLYCPTSLKNDDISPSIEESSSLNPKVMTVAGVQNRVYKNSVYKIKSDNGKRVYVAAEYATPLKTFRDVVLYNGEHSKHYQKHKNDIVLHFYLTLQKVLKEHVECTNYCELVFYDDKDENDKYKDVGKILLNQIKKLRRAVRTDLQ